MSSFPMRRDVRAKNRVKTEVKRVWERLMVLRREKNWDEGENPMSGLNQPWMLRSGEKDEADKACERRIEAEKGRIRRTGVVVKYS